MRSRSALAAAIGAVLLALGCTTAEAPEDRPADTEPDTAAATQADGLTDTLAGATADTSGPTWYARSRTLDLTGDDVPDTIRLEARGARIDSLRITMTITVNGEVKHSEWWGSRYELAMLDSAERRSPIVERRLRASLDSTVAGIAVRPLGTAGARLMAEDSAILSDITPDPARIVTFSYGYETTVRLAWDAPRERFVRLWSCC